jgi:hypothetical protein
VRATSATFVAALRAVANPSEQSAGGPDTAETLGDALKDVSGALDELSRALHAVDPQLSVHVPDIAQEVNDARSSRKAVVTRAEASLAALAGGEEAEDLAAVLADAEQAYTEIQHATESVRVFLASEFAFKDSF